VAFTQGKQVFFALITIYTAVREFPSQLRPQIGIRYIFINVRKYA